MAVKLAQTAGGEEIGALVRRFGFTTIPARPDLSVALGAYEVTLLELTSGFQVFQQGGKRITPDMWEKKTGRRLRFVYRSRGPSLLVADAVRLNTRGQAAVSKSKTGRGQVTAPIFLLVPQVKLRKRLDLARDAERTVDGVPGLIVAKWGSRSPA